MRQTQRYYYTEFPDSCICLYFPALTSLAMTVFWVLEYDYDAE